jgi:hypothetical protein
MATEGQVYSYGPISGYLCALDPNKSTKLTPSGAMVPSTFVWVIWPAEPHGWDRRQRMVHTTEEHNIPLDAEQAVRLSVETGAPFYR